MARMTALSSTMRILNDIDRIVKASESSSLRPDAQPDMSGCDVEPDGAGDVEPPGVLGLDQHAVLPEQLSQSEEIAFPDLERVVRRVRGAAGDLHDHALLDRAQPLAGLEGHRHT